MMPGKAPDMMGVRSGMLTVVARAARTEKGTHAMWECLCDCGKRITVQGQALRNVSRKPVESCGCKRNAESAERFTNVVTKHGLRQDPLYSPWAAMRSRCNRPTHKNYADYGGRGIKVAPAWDDFSVFKADMGPRPDGYTIERKDNNGDYCKENCVWASRADQAKNKRPYKKREKA